MKKLLLLMLGVLTSVSVVACANTAGTDNGKVDASSEVVSTQDERTEDKQEDTTVADSVVSEDTEITTQTEEITEPTEEEGKNQIVLVGENCDIVITCNLDIVTLRDMEYSETLLFKLIEEDFVRPLSRKYGYDSAESYYNAEKERLEKGETSGELTTTLTSISELAEFEVDSELTMYWYEYETNISGEYFEELIGENVKENQDDYNRTYLIETADGIVYVAGVSQYEYDGELKEYAQNEIAFLEKILQNIKNIEHVNK